MLLERRKDIVREPLNGNRQCDVPLSIDLHSTLVPPAAIDRREETAQEYLSLPLLFCLSNEGSRFYHMLESWLTLHAVTSPNLPRSRLELQLAQELGQVA